MPQIWYSWGWLSPFMCVCVCELMAHMCVCMYTAMCQWVYMSVPWKGQKGVLVVLLYCSPLYILRQELSLKLVLTDSANLAGQWTLASSYLLCSAGIPEVLPHNHIFMWWESELRSSRFCSNCFPDWAMSPSPSSPLRLIKLQGLHFPLTGICYVFKSFLSHIQWAPLGQCYISLDGFPVSSSSMT